VPYLLGIDIGESTVTAAMCPRTGRPPHGFPAELAGAAEAGWGPAQPVVLGSSGAAVAAALLLSPGGGLVAADSNPGHNQQAEQATGFVRRVGDDVLVRFANRAASAQALTAEMVGWTVGRLWQQQGEAPERIAVAHPTDWGPYRLGLLRAALEEAGLGEPALVPRAGAAVTAFQAAGQLPPHGTVLVVFRLGGTSLEVSLVNLHLSGQYELIAALDCTDIRGSDLDAADTAEQRSILQAGVDLAARTVAACRVQATELAAVLLAGGAAGHPMLADLLAVAFPVPVLVHGDPQLTVACGAALSVRPRARQAATAPAPAVAEFPVGQAPVADPGEAVAPGPQAALPPARPPVRVTAAPTGRR
jgi:molecular chaperone DnaK (HSP70)